MQHRSNARRVRQSKHKAQPKIADATAHGKGPRGIAALVGYPLAFAALCALAFGPGYALATEAAGADTAANAEVRVTAEGDAATAPARKDETVYVFTTADGTVTSTEVAVKLSNPTGASELTDSSALSGIENEKGTESYRASDAGLVWDASGNDISYRGDATAALPVSMRVSYQLDGNAIAPDELAGKSGNVKIRYDFANSSTTTAMVNGVERVIYTPFVAITGMMFDNEIFSDIEVTNGRAIDDDDRTVVVGYAMPGLAESLDAGSVSADIPGYFEVSARATGFEMKSTLTLASAGLFDSFDLSKFDTGELSGSSAQLKTAMGELTSGSSQLTDGLKELAGGAVQLAASTSEMQGQLMELPAGVQQLYSGSSALSEGLQEATEGTGSLVSGAQLVSRGADQLAYGIDGASGLVAAQAGASELASGLQSMPAAFEELKNGIGQAKSGADLAASKATASAADIAEAMSALQADPSLAGNAYVQRALAALGDAAEYLTSADAQNPGAIGAATAVGNGLEGALSGLDAKSDDISAAASGAAALASGIGDAAVGAQQLATGSSGLAEGAAALHAQLPAAAEGAMALNQGLGSLNASTEPFVAGVARIVSAIVQFANGTQSAADGSAALTSGLSQFNEQGISKITNLIDNDVLGFIGRLKAVRNAGEAYTNFSGITDGTEGSVKFVFETDAVSAR